MTVSKREAWLFGFAAVQAIGSLIGFLQWLDIKPGDLATGVTVPHPAWLAFAVCSFLLSIGTSLYGISVLRKQKNVGGAVVDAKPRLSKTELESIKTAGEAELLAWDAQQLKAQLQEVYDTLEVEQNKEALDKCLYPLSHSCFPQEHGEDEKWHRYHRSLAKFQNAYAKHRTRVMMLSLPNFKSVVTKHALGSNDFQETTRLRLPELLEEHRKLLLEKAAELAKPHTE
jgi:hypothetical protein